MPINTNIELQEEQIATTVGLEAVRILLASIPPAGVANLSMGIKAVEALAEEIGAEVVTEGSKVCLRKEILGKKWDILTLDQKSKTIDVVVDVKRGKKASIATGITKNDIYIPGYTVRTVHEVRGPLEWLHDTEKGRMITIGEEELFVETCIVEEVLPNGEIVRYNTWNFKPHAIFSESLSPGAISCESPEHKREFILKIADALCAGDPRLVGKFTPEIEAQLRRIHATRKAPTYLSGYEIHHNGYGEMLLLPKGVHCRKLAHIGGSWLMNTKNYAVYIENPTSLDTSVGDILTAELTPDKIKAYGDLSIETKAEWIASIGDKVLRDVGLSDVKIEFTDKLPPITCGEYDDNLIRLNGNLLDNPTYALLTELHEIRHTIQYDAIQHPEKYGFQAAVLDIWRNNIDHYILPELDLEAYILQPIEQDAEMWAMEMLHNVKNVNYV